jgi:amino acid adenylation domain-containing protein
LGVALAAEALTAGEREIWSHQARHPLSAAYNVTALVEIEGPLDPAALARVLDALAAEQTALRSRMEPAGDGWRRRVDPETGAALATVEVRGWPGRPVRHWVDGPGVGSLLREARRPFRPSERLARFVLWRLSPAGAVLQATLHHSVCDGLALRLLAGRLMALYAGSGEAGPAAGRDGAAAAPSLPWLPLASPAEAEGWWRDRLALAESKELLPVDHAAGRDDVGHLLRRTVPACPAVDLAAAAAALGCSPFGLALAAAGAVLAEWGGHEELAVRVPFSHRRPAEDAVVSHRVRTLPVRFRLGPDTTARDLCLSVRDELEGGLVCADAAEEVPAGVGPGTSVVVVDQLEPGLLTHRRPEPVATGGLRWTPHLLHNGTAKFDLTVFVTGAGASTALALEYRSGRFEPATIDALSRRLERALARLAAGDAGVPAARLAEPTRAELAAVRLRGPAARVPAGRLEEPFLRRAWRRPDDLCVVEDRPGDEPPAIMTYGELAEASERVAGDLRALGVGPGVAVALRLPRSLELMAGLYGTLRAGAAALMVDPELPEDRAAHLLADSRAAVALEPGAPPRRLREPGPVPLAAPETAREAAYLMYTSGSTGRPKGVAVGHAGIVNRLSWMQRALPLGPGSIVLAKTPLSFDVCIWELFWPLRVGATAVLAQHGRQGDAEYLVAAVERYGVDTVHFVPAMLTAFLDVATRQRCRTLARVITSGERLSVAQASRLHSRLGIRVDNLYGPTEASIDVTWWRFDPGEDRPYVPIGRPIDNTWIELRDAAGRPVATGAPGELVIGGVNVALGYVGDGALDEGRFERDVGGGRVYRTGDLARVRAGDVIEFLGRRDSQVKINGQRVELEEIEAVLAECPGVVTAGVVHDPGAPARDRLTAYVQPRPGAGPSAAELREWSAARLPPFMVPTAFRRVERLPYGATGKLDRQRLAGIAAPLLVAGAGTAGREGAAGPERDPAPPERALRSRVAELLGADPGALPGGVDLFYLGLDSISALGLVIGLRSDGIELTVADVFEARTLDNLLRRVRPGGSGPAPAAAGAAGTETERWRDTPVQRRFPLSKLQYGLLFHRDVSEDYRNYVTGLELRGPVDAGRLELAIAAVAAHHEFLRSAIDLGARDGPEQVVLERAPVWLAEHDLRGLGEEAARQVVLDWREAARRRQFAWAEPPLCAFHLHRLAGDRAILSIVEPLLDGWSVAVLARDVLDAYETMMARAAGRPVPPSAGDWEGRTEPPSYAEFVRLEREAEDSEASARFWRDRLEGADVCWELALERGTEGPGEWGRRSLELEETALAGLLRACRELEAPLRTVLLAAHLRMVSLFTGRGVVGTGLMTNGRPEVADGDRTCGLFLNVLPLTVDAGACATWRQLVARVLELERSVWRHRRTPYAAIRQSNPSVQPDTVFNFTNFRLYRELFEDEARSLCMERLDALDQTYFDVTVQCSLDPLGRRLRVSIDHRLPGVTAESAERLLASFVHLLGTIAEDLDGPPGERLLTGADRRTLRRFSGADGGRAWPTERRIASIVDEHARRRPSAVAIEDDRVTWSYGDLVRESDRLARTLLGVSATRAPVVGISAERSAGYWAAVLAVWRAGGTYVPVSVDAPARRTGEMLAQARVDVVLADVPRRAVLAPVAAAAGIPVLDLDPPAEPGRQERPAPPLVKPPAERAYVLFTSGSTGRPKGAVVGPDAMFNHWWSKVDLLGLDETCSVAQSAPASFDVSIWQCLVPWLVGGRAVVVGPDLLLAPGRLLDQLAERRIRVFETVPSHLAALLDAIEEGTVVWPRADLALERVMVTGEELPVQLVRRWFRAGGVPLVNAYGPTECADDVTHAVLAGEDGGDPVPIGRPVPNAILEVVDDRGGPVPPGVEGELRVAGACLGLGYLDPADERGRFETHAVAGSLQRTYRTGDRVRFRADGQLVWLGRADSEVKVRGRRIGLDELEHHVRAHPDVDEAAVVLVRRQAGDRLRAVLVCRRGGPRRDTLTEHLRARVPAWMLPDELLAVPALPLTPHGKVDRQSLAGDLAGIDARPLGGEMVPPADVGEGLEGVDARVAAAVREECERVLGRRLAPGGSFFEAGGSSLDSVRVVSRLGVRLGVEVPVTDLLRSAHLAEFARAVAARLGGPAPDTAAGSPPPGSEAAEAAADVRWHAATDPSDLLRLLPGSRLAAAAIGYVPLSALARAGQPREPVLGALRGLGGAVLRRVLVTPAGPVGHYLVPVCSDELFADPAGTADAVAAAVREARSRGAGCVALTGLLASALGYGAAIAASLPPGAVTTGHDVTAAAVVLNVARALQATGTALAEHDLAVVGLGSVGRAAARLLVATHGAPRSVLLVEAAGGLPRAERAMGELRDLGCGVVRCLAAHAGRAPSDVYGASLVVGAASAQDLLDVDGLRPGCIVVDDSAPHVFNVAAALERVRRSGDLYVTEGGMLRWPDVVGEIRWAAPDPALASLLGALKAYRRGPADVMGCLVAGVLGPALGNIPLLGEPDHERVCHTYRGLVDRGFEGVEPVLDDRPTWSPGP